MNAALILTENTFAVRAVGAHFHTQHGSKNSPVNSITDGKVSFTTSSRFSALLKVSTLPFHQDSLP